MAGCTSPTRQAPGSPTCPEFRPATPRAELKLWDQAGSNPDDTRWVLSPSLEGRTWGTQDRREKSMCLNFIPVGFLVGHLLQCRAGAFRDMPVVHRPVRGLPHGRFLPDSEPMSNPPRTCPPADDIPRRNGIACRNSPAL